MTSKRTPVATQTVSLVRRFGSMDDGTNGFAMTTEQCRANAEECISLAAQTSNPEIHTLFLRVARSWRWLAGDCDDRARDATHPGGLPGRHDLGVHLGALAGAGAA
jgi:hypothetical protein